MANTENDFWGNGWQEAAFIGTTTTLTNAAMGITQEVTASVTTTLPAAAVGSLFAFRVGAPGLTVKIKPASTETMTGMGFTPTASNILTLANAPAGSTVILLAGSTSNWNIVFCNLGGAARSVLAYAAT